MNNYYIYNGVMYSEDELMHYGVPGMKWGVRKAEYKAMNRQQRKAQRKKYLKTAEGKVYNATRLGTMFGGPLVGTISGLIANKKYNSGSSKAKVSKGKNVVEKNANKKVSDLSTKTESKRVADLKSRVTGKKEDGKPAFLMNEQEHKDFDARYDQRRAAIKKRLSTATSQANRNKLADELERLDTDYLNVVEQDFWYSDD